MKKFLFLIGLFLVTMQFIPQAETQASEMPLCLHKEIIKEKNDAADMQDRIETISNELKGSNFLTPRRTAQTIINLTVQARILSETVRTGQYVRLREVSRLQKVSEYILRQQTLNRSALLTRMGYHVYAFRQIII